jgi:hypothetical protein
MGGFRWCAVGVLLLAGCMSSSTTEPASVKGEDPLAAKVAAHRFWITKPTAEQIVKLADQIVELHRKCAVMIDDHFEVHVLDPDKDKDAATYLQAQRDFERTNSPVGFGPKNVKGHYIVQINLFSWKSRPSREDVLSAMLSAADKAEFLRPR